MLREKWHKIIIAYRLEDEYGNCPYYYDGYKAMLPDGYLFAYMNPSRFKESDYKYFCYKMSLYEYLLLPSVLTYETGQVLFKPNEVISKAKIGR